MTEHLIQSVIGITGKEIKERFIRAHEIIERMGRVGPKQPGNSWVPTINSFEEKWDWGSKRFEDERKAFWRMSRTAKAWEVTEAQETMGWLQYVPDESERRCLNAWAACMSERGHRQTLSFKAWCKGEGICEMTGARRRERAVLRILLALAGKSLLHNENDIQWVLPDPHDLSDKTSNMADGATHWNDGAITLPGCEFDASLRDFSWAKGQDERRRQREAQRRKAA